MAGYSETVNLQINAIGNFSNVIGEVNKLQSRLQSLKLPANLNGKFESSLKDIINKYNQFQSLAEKGVQTKGDFSKLNNSARDFENSLRSLKKELTGISEKDIRVRVNNLPEVKELEEEIKRLSVTYKDLQHLGTNKISGSFGEKEVQNIRKLVGESKTLKPLLEQAFSAIKTGNIDDSLVAINRFETALNKIRGAAANQFGLDRKLDIQKYINEARLELERMGNGASEVKAKLDQIKADRFNQMKNGISGAINQLDRLGDSASRSTKEILETARASQNVGSQLSNLQTQANYFFGLQNMLQLFRRGLRDTIQTVRDLDKAMTDTAVVTDMTVSDLWAQLPDYTKLANKLGATTQGAYETMTLYYQQGLNKQETFEIGEETMKMARIAGLDYAQTTNMMTAALRGFNMELNQTSAKRVNDVYSELAAITASDTRELGLAMERTASIAHSANMDFGNTTAFLAQMIETTREAPENLGTAMKTIIARFQELKENPYKISEVEGEEVDFNRVDKALKSIGVNLMDNRDKFRDLDDVFMDISSRWDGLSQTQQRYVATIAAGARQQSRFLAMVQNYDRLKQLTDAAANSEGASDVQFSKTLDSMEAKLNKLNNAWQQFTMGITNNELIKSGTGFLVKMLDAINKFETGIEHLGDNIGGVFGDIFKSITSFSALLLGFKGLGKLTDIGIGMLGGMLGMGKGTKTKMFGGMSGIRQATNAAQAKAISNPIVAAIEKATSIITKTPMASKQAQENLSPTKAATKQNLVEARQKLNYLGSVKGNVSPQDFSKAISGHGFSFTYKDVDNIVKDFDKEVQTALYRNQKGTRKALERTFNNSLKNMNISDGAKNVASNLYSNLDYQMATGRADISKTLGTLFNPTKLGRQIGGDYGTEIRKAALKEYGRIRQEGIQRGYKGKELIQFVKRNKGSQLETTLNEKEIAANTSRMQNFTSSVNSAGSAMMQLGMTFQSIGFGRLGGIISTLGSGLLSLGMTAEVAANGFRLLKTEAAGALKAFAAAAPMMAVAAGAFIAAFAAYKIKQKQIKEIRKNGKEVVDAYEETTKSVETNLNKLNKYEPDWGNWSAGVDKNGNNINLGAEEYQDYKKAVKDIIKMHPELIKGYNAEGDAIVDNNSVLRDAIKLEEEREKTATKEYLNSGQKIIDRRNSTKRWQKGQQQTITPNQLSRGAGTFSVEKSVIEKDAQKVTDAIKKIDNGDELLKKWNITFDELGNITQDGITTLRDHAGDFQNELNKTWENPTEAQQKLLDSSNDAIAQLGLDFKGIEEVSKETFDALKVYATDKKFFDTIDSNLVAPFQTAISRIAEQDLSWSDMKGAVNDIGKEFSTLDGHIDEYNEILETVEEAQAQFGKDLDLNKYNNSIDDSIDKLEDWKSAWDKGTDSTSKVLSEWAQNQIETFKNISEGTIELADAFNVMSGRISSANGVYERWSKANENGDLYTGVENFKKMMDEVNDGVDNLEKGSSQWWTAAQAMFGDDYIFEHSKSQIQSHMKDVSKYLEDGSEGIYTFMNDLSQNLDKELDSDILGFKNEKKEKPYKISDFIDLKEDGSLDFSKLGKAPDEAFTAIAKALGQSDDLFTSLMNKARQFGNIQFGNVDQMRTALATSESTIIGKGSTNGSKNIYTRESNFRTQALEAGLRPNEIKQYQKKLEKTGTTFLKSANEINKGQLSKYIKDWGISTGKYQTKRGEDRFQTTTDAFIKYFDKAGYSKEEIQQIYDTATDGTKSLIDDYQKTNFNEAYRQAKEANSDPAVAAAQSIDGKVGSLLGVAESIAAGMGILTSSTKNDIKDAKQETREHASNLRLGTGENYESDKKTLENDIVGLEDVKASLEAGQANYEEGTKKWKEYQDEIDSVKNTLEIARKALDSVTEASYAEAQAKAEIKNFAQAPGGQAALKAYNENGFGNTDPLNRQVLDWSKEGFKTSNFENAKTWGWTKEDLKGTISTYMSSGLQVGEGENAIQIPVTPMLQTESGTPEVLSQSTVQKYLNTIAEKATDENGKINIADLMKFDQEGTEIDGKNIHDLIMGAFTGDGAEEASGALGQLEHLISEAIIPENTDFAGLKQAAQDANILGQNLASTGTQGREAADSLTTSFLRLNQEGLSQLEEADFNSVITSLGLTRNEVQAIDDADPTINLRTESDTTQLDETEEKTDAFTEEEHTATITVETGPDAVNPDSLLEKGGFAGATSGLTIPISTEDEQVNETSQKLEDLNDLARQGGTYSLHVDGLNDIKSAARAAKNLSKTKETKTISLKTGKADLKSVDDAKGTIERTKAKMLVGANAKSALTTAEAARKEIDSKSATIDVSTSVTGNYVDIHVTKYVKTKEVSTGGFVSENSISYKAKGGTIFRKKGTDTVPAMLTPGEYVQKRSAVQYFGIDFMREVNHLNTKGALQELLKKNKSVEAGSSAKGRHGTVGPKNNGGLTLTGEKGFEIAWLPSENKSMILGAEGPQMINLPRDAIVWSNEQSKKILKQQAIPAGSHGNPGGTFKLKKTKPKTTTTTTTTTNNNNDDNKKKKKSGSDSSKKNNKTITKILQKAGKINLWWWNMTKKVEATQRKIDKLNKQTEKLLKQIGSTLGSIGKTVGQYITKLNKQISLNTTMRDTANRKLTTLNKGTKYTKKASKANKKYSEAAERRRIAERQVKKASKTKSKKDDRDAKKELNRAKKAEDRARKKANNANKKARKKGGVNYSTISYEVTKKSKKKGEKKWKKEKKTKKAKINLAPYITYDPSTGAYQIDYNKINKKFGKNKSKAKAVGEAAQKKLEDYQGKKNTAEDNITKAQEALEQLGQQLYDTFFGWELELTKIWNITQKIEQTTAEIGRLTGYVSLMDAQIAAYRGENDEELFFKRNEAGEKQLSDFMTDYINTFAAKVQASVQKIKQQFESIDASKTELASLADPNAKQGAIDKYSEKLNATKEGREEKEESKKAYNKDKKNAKKKKKQENQARKKMRAARKKANKKGASKKDKKAYKDAQKEYQEAKVKTKTANTKRNKSQKKYETAKNDYNTKVQEGTYYNKTDAVAYEAYLKELQDEQKIRNEARNYTNIIQNADGTISIDFDTDKFVEDRDNGKINGETAGRIQKYVQDLADQTNDLNQKYTDAEELLQEQYEALSELSDEWAGIGEELLTYYEEEQSKKIDQLKTLSDDIRDALKDLLDEVKTSLEQRRQAEDNAKTEKDISKKQQRLAALRANTAGGNQVEIAQLEKEIADAQQDYQRTLEDQLLEKLNSQAEVAEKQRAEMIELQQAVLEATNNAAQVNDWMNEPEKYQDEIRKAFYDSKDYDNLTKAQQDQLDEEFRSLYSKMLTYKDRKKILEEGVDNTKNELASIKESINTLIDKIKIETQQPKQEENKDDGDDDGGGSNGPTEEQKEAYRTELDTINKNDKITYDEFVSLRDKGKDIGKESGRVIQDIANEIGWEKVLKALKGKYNKYRLAATFTSERFKSAYDKAYGGAYATNRAKALADPTKYPPYIVNKYAGGGLATKTGPAWLDGTPSKPELVLNAQDTKNFMALRDILGSIMSSTSSINNSASTAMYEININVDHINNDYDVDKIAARVKKDIVKGAGYRNVTQVRNLR